MSPIRAFVPGLIVPKQSARFSRSGRTYQPAAVTAYKTLVSDTISTARGGHSVGGPVSVVLVLVMPRSGATMKRASPTGRIPHDVTPDIDNLTKAILDGITAGGAWVDDGQVVHLDVTKVRAAIIGEHSRADMRETEAIGAYITITDYHGIVPEVTQETT